MKKLLPGKYLFLLTILYSLQSNLFAVTSAQSGAWNNPLTWVGGVVPTASDPVIIALTHIVNIPSGYTAQNTSTITVSNGNGTRLIIDAGGVLELSGSITLGTLLASRGQLAVNGTVRLNQGATIVNAAVGRLLINTGATYQHNYTTTAGIIYTGTFAVGSTLAITGYTTNNTNPTFGNTVYHHFLWNCQNQVEDVIFTVAPPTFNGDVTIESTNDASYALFLTENGSYTWNIFGSLTIGSEGILGLAVSGGTNIINLRGNLTYNMDDAILTGGSNSSIVFAGSTAQLVDDNGFILNTEIDYLINSGAILDLGTSALTGAGNFTLSSNAVLRVGSTDLDGAIQSNSNGGNIRVEGTRTFANDATATIVYNGTSKQFLGTGYPNAEINLTIDNAANVEIAGFNANIQANSTLSLLAGSLIVGGNQLVIDGNLTATSGTITTSSGSTIIVNGTGNLSTIPFATSPTIIGYLTINRGGTGNVPIGNALTVTGTLDLQLGQLVFNNQTLTITGNLANNGGTLSGNTASRLLVQGTGTLTGSIPFDATGNSIKTLIIDRSAGTVTLGSALTVSDTLSLTQGALTATSLTLGNNATLIKNTGSISAAPLVTGANAYNVTYASGVDVLTGTELPSTGTALNNLTISRNTGTVTLASGITVNGNLNITSGTLSTSGSNFPITVRGNFTNNSTFTPNAGTITFGGTTAQTIGGSVATSFNNLSSTNAAGVGLSNDITISGALDISSGALSINSRTLTLAGTVTSGNLTGSTTSNLVINGSGTLGSNLNFTQTSADTRSLRNFTLNRTGGTVALGTALDLAGIMTLTTGTLNTNGQTFIVNLNTAAIDGSGSGAISGNLTVAKTIVREGYVDFGPVLNGVTYADLSNSGTQLTNPFVYDETQHNNLNYGSTGWVTPPAVLAPTQGVTGRINTGNTTLDATGTYAHTDQVASLTFTQPTPSDITQDGFNLIANPFPSVLDWNAVPKPAYVDNALYYYQGAGSYVSYVNGTPSGLGLNLIPSMQGIFVKANASCTSPCSLTLPKAARVAAAKANFREGAISNVLRLKVASGSFSDATYLKFDDMATPDYDGTLDAFKFKNSAGMPSIYTVLNKIEYSINSLPFTYGSKVIPVKIEAGFDGAYTLELSEDAAFDTAYSVTLVDTRLNKTIDFKSTPNYTYSASKADTATRFYLNLKFNEVITGISNEMGSAMSLYNTGNIVTTRFNNVNQTNAIVTVSDMLGHEVYHNDNADISSGIFNFALMNNPSGIYLVKVLTGNDVLSGKILIKN